MHIIASLKGFRLQTHADEGMPVASRAVQVRIRRCTHDQIPHRKGHRDGPRKCVPGADERESELNALHT